MTHDYKYEGMREEDRNALIPAIRPTRLPTQPPLGTQRDCRKINPAARRIIDGIIIQSSPQLDWEGYWQTENGRAVIRRRGPHDGWTLLIDGKKTGNNQFTNLTESVRANAWAIKPTTPK